MLVCSACCTSSSRTHDQEIHRRGLLAIGKYFFEADATRDQLPTAAA
jgi:hypothetical protein